MPPKSSHRLVINTVANFVGKIWMKLLAVLIIPFLFRYLGASLFAVYSLGIAVMALASLIDPGLRHGYVKIMAEYIAKGQTRGMRQIVLGGAAFYLVYSAMFLGGAWLLIDPVMHLAGVAQHLDEARFFFLAMLISLCINNVFVSFRCYLDARQRMGLVNALAMAGALQLYGGIIVVIWMNLGLRGLGINFVLYSLMLGVLFVLSNLYLIFGKPQGDESPSLRDTFKRLFSFGFQMQIANSCDDIVFHSDKFFISRFIGLETAGFYQLGSTLAMALRELIKLFISGLLPVATTVAALRDMATVRRVNRLTSRWLFIFSSPCFVFVAAAAPAFIVLWMGKPIPEAALSLSLLSLAFYANTAVAAATVIGAACHFPRIQMTSASFAAIANIILNLLLVQRFGLYGVGAASIIALTFGAFGYLHLLSRAIGESMLDFFKDVFLKPFVVSGGLGLILHFAAPRLALWVGNMGRWQGIALLAGVLIGMTAIYAVILIAIGHIRREDFRRFKTQFKPEPVDSPAENIAE